MTHQKCGGIVLLTAILSTATVSRLSAETHGRIALFNVSVQAGLTLVSATIQGKVHSLKDVTRCLGIGAASGYGLYHGKSLVAAGHVQTGWIVANLSSSLSENVAAGRYPLAQFGYTFGPVRIRVSLRHFEPKSSALIHVDIVAFQVAALVAAASRGDAFEWRDGWITFRRDTPFPGGEGAKSYGVFPVLYQNADEAWTHEAVHAVQSLQLDVIEPFGFRLTGEKRSGDESRRVFRLDNIKFGAFNVANLLFLAQPYHHRWFEIEAYRLANNQTPPVIDRP